MKKFLHIPLLILAISCENGKSSSKGSETLELHSYVTTYTKEGIIFVRVEAQDDSLRLTLLPPIPRGRSQIESQGGSLAKSETSDSLKVVESVAPRMSFQMPPLRLKIPVESSSDDEAEAVLKSASDSLKVASAAPRMPFQMPPLRLKIPVESSSDDEAEDVAPEVRAAPPLFKARGEAVAIGAWLATKPLGDRSLFGQLLGRGTQGDVYAVSDKASAELKLPGKYVVKVMNGTGIETLSKVHGTTPGEPLQAIAAYVNLLDGLAAKGMQVPKIVLVKPNGSGLWELSPQITPFKVPKFPGEATEDDEDIAINLLTSVSKLDAYGYRHNDISPDNIDSTGELFDWGSAAAHKSVTPGVGKVNYYEGGFKDKGAAVFVALIALRILDPENFEIFDHIDTIEATAQGKGLEALSPKLQDALKKMAREAFDERQIPD